MPRRLDQLRRKWLNPEENITEAEQKKRTLTNLYDQHPTWLQNAHARLDRTDFAAYGWPEGFGDEEILKNLLALNLERSAIYSGSHCSWTVSVIPTVEGETVNIQIVRKATSREQSGKGSISLRTAIGPGK
jgi:hypothetical protein